MKTKSSVSLPLKSMKKNGKEMGERGCKTEQLIWRPHFMGHCIINSVSFLGKTGFKNQLFTSYTLNKVYCQKFPFPILQNFPFAGIKRLKGCVPKLE